MGLSLARLTIPIIDGYFQEGVVQIPDIDSLVPVFKALIAICVFLSIITVMKNKFILSFDEMSEDFNIIYKDETILKKNIQAVEITRFIFFDFLTVLYSEEKEFGVTSCIFYKKDFKYFIDFLQARGFEVQSTKFKWRR